MPAGRVAMDKLEAKFEWKDHYLLVTASGQVSVEETIAIYKKACDLAGGPARPEMTGLPRLSSAFSRTRGNDNSH